MIYTDGTHLIADTLDELHEFARSIGLKREWFQDHKHPHYDLTTHRMIKKAEKFGARKVTTRELIKKKIHNEMLEFICFVLSGIRLSANDEYGLQDGIARIFYNSGIPYEREVMIGTGERIDFMVDSIGIEVKIDGPVSSVVKQLQRYAKSTKIDTLVLITTKATHEQQIPDQISGIKLKKISLWKNRL